MKILLFIFLLLISSTFSNATNWQSDECPISSNQYLVEQSSFHDTFTFSCSNDVDMADYHNIGNKKFYCASAFVKKAVNFNETGSCDNDSYITVQLNYIKYSKKNDGRRTCGEDSFADSYNQCICQNPNLIYDESSSNCSCPNGKVEDSEGICVDNCEPLGSSYQSSNFSESECTLSNLQTLYNQNNTDGRKIISVKWHCDNKCYFVLDGTTGQQGEKGDKGDKGDKGEKGDKGDKGDKGEKGEKGDKGDKGEAGKDGLNGLNGIQGEKGEQGIQGEKGEAGKDAPSGEYTDILNQINSSIIVGNTQVVDSINSISSDITTSSNRNHDDLENIDNTLSNGFGDLGSKLDEMNEYMKSGESNTEATDSLTDAKDKAQNTISSITNSLNQIISSYTGSSPVVTGTGVPVFTTPPIYGKTITFDLSMFETLRQYFDIIWILMLAYFNFKMYVLIIRDLLKKI